MDVVFVHGAGKHGADAWPRQAAVAEAGWLFLPREGVADDASRDARRLLDWLRARGGGHVALPVTTFVVTGGSSRLYEETAAALVALGAQHLTVDGAGHRVQDDPRTSLALQEHWTA